VREAIHAQNLPAWCVSFVASEVRRVGDWLLACVQSSRGLQMANVTSADHAETGEYVNTSPGAQSSGVSWGGLGGAFVMASSSLILLALGAGFWIIPGFSVVRCGGFRFDSRRLINRLADSRRSVLPPRWEAILLAVSESNGP
jgi:hypothetical protein